MLLRVTVLLLAALASAKQNFDILVNDQNMKDPTENLITIEDIESRTVDGNLETDIYVTLEDTLPADTQLCVVGLEKLQSGSYEKSTLNIPCTNLCELIKNDTCVYPLVQQQSEGTLPENGCPFPPGKYKVIGLQLKVPCLPDTIPGGDYWKFNVLVQDPQGKKIYYDNEVSVEFRKKSGGTQGYGR